MIATSTMMALHKTIHILCTNNSNVLGETHEEATHFINHLMTVT